MPEGPETKRMVDTIKKSLLNQELVSTSFLHDNLKNLDTANISILDVTSKGKAVIIRLSDGNSIITHNQLYGRWTSNRLNTKIRHNRSLRIEFCTNSKAVRLWSATDIIALPTAEESTHPYLKRIGPDVLDKTTTYKLIYDRLVSKRFRNRRFSGLLLNQHFISGLGNYLRSEILFLQSSCIIKKHQSLIKIKIRNFLNALRTFLLDRISKKAKQFFMMI